MLKKVEAYIREHKMLNQRNRVIAAVSGGADSVCLLHLLVSLRQQMELEIQVIHVHHGLRGPEADRDAQFVRELSEMWKVPCLVVYRDAAKYGKEHGKGVEEAGRELRYQAFLDTAQKFGADRIAVAHHQGDQAETILHNLFRGSGLRGLCGMAPVRENIIRPLLCVNRQEILEYLDERGISYCEDSTNSSTEYMRNRLRHRIIPMICQEINPEAAKHVAAAGERLWQAEQYFRQEAGRIWQEYGQSDKKGRQQGISGETLTGLPDILKGYVVMEMLAKLTGFQKDITSLHVAQILDLAKKGTGRSCNLPYGIKAWKEYDMVWLEQTEQETGSKEELAVQEEGANHKEEMSCFPYPFTKECFPASVLREKYQKIPENKYTKWFDYDKIKGALSVRTRRTGDFFILKNGGKKTVKAFMIDEKIPRGERDQIWMLAEGQHVLWIVGYRISEFYKVTEETKKILQVKMDGGKEHGE